METAEKSDNGIQSVISLSFTHSLKSPSELVITIGSNIVSSKLALVHEVLESYIPILLETDIIEETLLDHLIHLLLQS